ncbi:MAG: IS200/IS605 family transposase [Balneolaceae bacterium]
MANTYHQIYIQSIIAVKYRKALIHPSWKPKLLGVIGSLINETGCKTLIVNGVEDHVHLFLGLKPSLSVSGVMQTVKAKSSKWLNENDLLSHRFEWQPGYGCFSYSHSHISGVYKYIKNQEEHHKKFSFREEYLDLLKKFEIDYDERFIFSEPE